MITHAHSAMSQFNKGGGGGGGVPMSTTYASNGV